MIEFPESDLIRPLGLIWSKLVFIEPVWKFGGRAKIYGVVRSDPVRLPGMPFLSNCAALWCGTIVLESVLSVSRGVAEFALRIGISSHFIPGNDGLDSKVGFPVRHHDLGNHDGAQELVIFGPY